MHLNSDGMVPPSYEPSSYQFNPDKAGDGHYQVYVNDTLHHDFFIYKHWPLGRQISPHSPHNVTYGWYIQPYPDGELWVLYGDDEKVRDRHWGGKNTEASPVTEEFVTFDDGVGVEEVNIYAAGQVVGRRTMNVTANTFRWEDVDTSFGYVIKDLRHPHPDLAYIDSFKRNKNLNGQYTFILKEIVDEGNMRYYRYLGLALQMTFKDNRFVSWTMLRKHKHKFVELTTYEPATKPILSRDKAQEYLENVLLKGQ